MLATNEDAPQVVGVIDERPMHMRIDDYRQSDLWRPLGAQNSSADAEKETTENIREADRRILRTADGIVLKGASLWQRELRIKIKTEPDSSPPRKSNYETDGSSKKNRTLFDGSPPKRRDSVNSLTRRETDSNPPRKHSRRNSSDGSPRKDTDSSPPRKRQTPDSSPPRRRFRRNSDNSPPRRKETPDVSPPRRRQKDAGNSLPGRASRSTSGTPRTSVSGRNSPPTRKLLPGTKSGKYLIPAKRQEKTLEGKKAGLQNANELVVENESFRRRENELFKNLSSDVSGANAATIVRDRKTGKIRDFQKEEEEKREKDKEEEKNKEKYEKWGKGLKQVEDYENKLSNDLHEMNKPLARYADDEDLERYLREREREGDPMLDYIRKKKKKTIVESGTPVKPQYEGEFMPNRFGIVPGHRWDGVDRSNEYEKKWFQVQNAKRAQQEEVYKWSTEDM